MADIFISYSRQDADAARELVRVLERAGLTTWSDTELLPGVNWQKQLRDELDKSKLVIALMSPAARISNWVQAEAMLALGASKLLPVLVPGMSPQDIPMPFAAIQSARLDDATLAEQIRRAIVALPRDKTVPDTDAANRAAALEAATARGEQVGYEPDKAPASIFVVHGHDDDMLLTFIAELKRLGIRPIVLRDVDTAHDFLYEKFRVLAGEAQHALVLISGDDLAASLRDYEHPAGAERSLQFRARQNVILELGFFFGKLGPDKVFVFERRVPANSKFLPRLERPSDLDGRMFLSFDEAGGWREKLRSRLADHGFELRAE